MSGSDQQIEAQVWVQPTRYTVSAVPEDHPEHRIWALTVENRGRGRWAVCHFGECLGVDGTWDYEHQPSGRTDEWLERYRFDRDTALALAREAAPKVTFKGVTAAQAAAGG